MCDNCGSIFPEGMEGAESGTAEVVRTVDGYPRRMQVVRDNCADCVSGRTQATTWSAKALTALRGKDK